jgi:hypothetical protein
MLSEAAAENLMRINGRARPRGRRKRSVFDAALSVVAWWMLWSEFGVNF